MDITPFEETALFSYLPGLVSVSHNHTSSQSSVPTSAPPRVDSFGNHLYPIWMNRSSVILPYETVPVRITRNREAVEGHAVFVSMFTRLWPNVLCATLVAVRSSQATPTHLDLLLFGLKRVEELQLIQQSSWCAVRLATDDSEPRWPVGVKFSWDMHVHASVLSLYDTAVLRKTALELLHRTPWRGVVQGVDPPSDPSLFSFWLARAIFVSQEDRSHFLLSLDGTHNRLRHLIKLLEISCQEEEEKRECIACEWVVVLSFRVVVVLMSALYI